MKEENTGFRSTHYSSKFPHSHLKSLDAFNNLTLSFRFAFTDEGYGYWYDVRKNCADNVFAADQ